MAKTYAQFKSYLSTFLWRTNDTVLSNNLDDLIRMADAEIDRRLNIEARKVSLQLNPQGEDVASDTYGFSDIKTIMSVSNNSEANTNLEYQFKQVPEGYIYAKRVETDSVSVLPYFAASNVFTSGDTTDPELYLRFVAPWSASDPGDIQLVYQAKIPDYETDDYSWVEDQYFDYYVYTVLSHCAPFVQEDERVDMWFKLKEKALTDILDHDRREVAFGGSPLNMRPHHRVPYTRRRV